MTLENPHGSIGNSWTPSWWIFQPVMLVFWGGYQHQSMVVVVGLGWVVWDSRDTPNNPLSCSFFPGFIRRQITRLLVAVRRLFSSPEWRAQA